MSIARIAEKIENPSVTQLLAAYPDKEKFDEAVRAGRIKPTTEAGVAANIFNRIVAAALAKQARIQGERTVFQELTAPQRMGLGAIAPGMGQPQQPQGIDQIPVPDQMFEPQGMAGGGVVAFQAGDLVKSPTDKIAAYFQSLKDFNPSEFKGIRGAELSAMMSNTRGLKVDPVTGNPISLGEFIRRVNSGNIQIPETFSATPTAPSFTQALAGPPIDDSAEMARFARQAQGTGVPMTPPSSLPPPPPPPRETPTATSAAPASAVPGLREQLMGRIREAYPDLAGGVKPAEPSVKGIFQEREEAERIAGVDKDFFKNEARNIVKQRDELKGDKKEAANMRLIEAGLRIMGGESPYAFVNIGKGASEALKGFADDVKDIQKTKREYDKAERELRTAEQLYARNKSDEALKEVQRRRELAQERNASFQKAMMEMQLKLEDIGIRREALGIQRQQVAQGASSPLERIAERLRKENPNLSYEQSVQKAYGMQQEPKTRAALEKEFLENPILVRQYGTYENYLKATSGGGTNYRERYGLE